MVGRGLLMECMDSPDVESILLINRKNTDLKHHKIKEVILYDYFAISAISESIKGYDTCFYSMGVTSVGAKEEEYKKVMYDAVMVVAKELLAQNPTMVFCFISGKGTDAHSKTMWRRIKGEAENSLLNLGFKDAYMFRPGHIQPMRGIRSRTGWYNIYYAIFGKLFFLLKRIPSFVTDTVTLGKAMIKVAKEGYSKKILESQDINSIGHKA